MFYNKATVSRSMNKLILSLLFITCLCVGCRNINLREFNNKYNELVAAVKETGEEYERALFQGDHNRLSDELVIEYARTAVDKAVRRLEQDQSTSPLAELFILGTACATEKLPARDQDYARKRTKSIIDKIELILTKRQQWRNSAHVALRIMSIFPRKNPVPLLREIIQETKGFRDYYMLCWSIVCLIEAWPLIPEKEKKAIRKELETKAQNTKHEQSRSAIKAYLEQMKY